MDVPEEKTNTLSRCGSFYYNTLVDASKEEAEFVSHLTWESRIFSQLNNINTAVIGKSHYRDFFHVVKFSDADISWCGLKEALQKRSNTHAYNIYAENYRNRYGDYQLGPVAMLKTELDKILTDEEDNKLLVSVDDDGDATLPGYILPEWELVVDPSLLVTSIKAPGGTLLLAGQDFCAEYGRIRFYENPIHLFPRMQFFAQSCFWRKPSLYNHMLQLGSVYDPPVYVLKHYRAAQTPESLYLATAQACGMAVTRVICKVLHVSPLHLGYAYDTTDGRYDAPYPHTKLRIGAVLPEAYVIGGRELFLLCGPTTALPEAVHYLNLDMALPIKGLSAPNQTIEIYDDDGNYRPQYLGTTEALEAFWDYVNAMEPVVLRARSVSENGIEHFRNTVCGGKSIVACINEETMPSDMRMRLLEFLTREAPVGSVLAIGEMNSQPPEPEYGRIYNNTFVFGRSGIENPWGFGTYMAFADPTPSVAATGETLIVEATAGLCHVRLFETEGRTYPTDWRTDINWRNTSALTDFNAQVGASLTADIMFTSPSTYAMERNPGGSYKTNNFVTVDFDLSDEVEYEVIIYILAAAGSQNYIPPTKLTGFSTEGLSNVEVLAAKPAGNGFADGNIDSSWAVNGGYPTLVKMTGKLVPDGAGGVQRVRLEGNTYRTGIGAISIIITTAPKNV